MKFKLHLAFWAPVVALTLIMIGHMFGIVTQQWKKAETMCNHFIINGGGVFMNFNNMNRQCRCLRNNCSSETIHKRNGGIGNFKTTAVIVKAGRFQEFNIHGKQFYFSK